MVDALDFEAFCHAQHSRLVRTLTLYCGNQEIARELAQEALMRAFAHWRKVRRLDSPGAWLNRVAINLANSHFRRKAAERRANQTVASRGEGVHHDADSSVSITLRAAVAALPARQRAALVLRYFADLSIHQTADLLSCEAGTVKKLTARAIENLRRVPELEDLVEVSDAG